MGPKCLSSNPDRSCFILNDAYTPDNDNYCDKHQANKQFRSHGQTFQASK